MEDLLAGKALTTEIDEQIVFKNLILENEDKDCVYELVLTNHEVLFMFRNMIKSWFSDDTEGYNEFIKIIIKNDISSMNYYINEISLQMFSYFDIGTQPSLRSHPENFYHGFVLGLMVDLRNRYVISSNRERGFGRYDIMLDPLHEEDDTIIRPC